MAQCVGQTCTRIDYLHQWLIKKLFDGILSKDIRILKCFKIKAKSLLCCDFAFLLRTLGYKDFSQGAA